MNTRIMPLFFLALVLMCAEQLYAQDRYNGQRSSRATDRSYDLLIINNGDGSDIIDLGDDLLIINNGDGSDFSDLGNDLLIVNNGDGSDFLDESRLIELFLSAGLRESEIALLLPAVQAARG